MEYKNPYLPEPPPRYEDDRTTHFMAVSTVVPTPIAVLPNALAVGPSMASCPSCQSRQLTTVHHEPNTNTHLLALLLCVIGCIPCVCIPYCTKSCQTAVHHCSRCNAYIGSYQS